MAKLMAEELIDAAEYRSRKVFESGVLVQLEPGDALFSTPDWMELTGATEKQVRFARERLKEVGFLTWRRVSASDRARTVYSLTEWQRFIAADGNSEGGQRGANMASKGRVPTPMDRASASPLGYRDGESRASNLASKPSRVSRANVQSSELQSYRAVRAVLPDDSVRTRTREEGPPHPHASGPFTFGLTAEEHEEHMAFMRLSADEQDAILAARNGGSHD